MFCFPSHTLPISHYKSERQRERATRVLGKGITSERGETELELLSKAATMGADKGKKLKVDKVEEENNSDAIDEKLVLSIEKLQEIQDELEKV